MKYYCEKKRTRIVKLGYRLLSQILVLKYVVSIVFDRIESWLAKEQ